MDIGYMKKKIEGMASTLLSWEHIKDKIYPCLAPLRWRKARGIHAVYKRFLDLAVYYNIRIEGAEGDMAAAWVGRLLTQEWGIDLDTMDGQAMENAKGDGYTIQGMSGIIGVDPDLLGMCVMTNRRRYYGAAGFLDKDMLAQFAETKGTDIYIIPSSIHEILLLPATKTQDGKGLDEVIREVNRHEVDPDDRLADHHYYYEAATGDIHHA